MRSTLLYGFLLSILIVSCSENVRQSAIEVKHIESPAHVNSSLPFLFSNSETTLLSWVEKANDGLTIFRYTEYVDGVWQVPTTILGGTDWFVNWADFPSIVENKGHFFTHILKKSSAETYAYDVKMNLKPKNSEWKTNISLHDDGTPTEHGFVTALPYGDDSFFVVWLDGRNTANNAEEEPRAMTIRSAVVSSSGAISDENLLDARTCDCCQTTAAITANGPVVIYRDRSKDEVRDISIVRQIDGKWTSPSPVHNDHWKINGCPVNGPKASALGNTLAVAWFTEANKRATVKVSFSQNNGARFEEPIELSSSNVIGRVDLVLIDKQTALASYVEADGKKAYLKVVKVKANGEISTPKTITDINASRKSGFPQMELVGNKVLFAWTAVNPDSSIVKTVSISIKGL